jgi:hypothetical protein
MQERERPGDRLVAADQAIGGIAAEGGEHGAVAEADGRMAAHSSTKAFPAGPSPASTACSSVGSSSLGDAITPPPLFSYCSHRRFHLLWFAS